MHPTPPSAPAARRDPARTLSALLLAAALAVLIGTAWTWANSTINDRQLIAAGITFAAVTLVGHALALGARR